jgi:hypothetical protein
MLLLQRDFEIEIFSTYELVALPYYVFLTQGRHNTAATPKCRVSLQRVKHLQSFSFATQ